MTQYAYSFNEEDYTGSFDTIDEAIAEASCDNFDDATHCSVGEVEAYEMREFLPDILERIDEKAADESAYAEYGFINSDKVTEKELQDALIAIFEKKGMKPNFWKVVKTKDYKLEVDPE